MKDIKITRLKEWQDYRDGCYMASFAPKPYILRLGVSKANAVARLEKYLISCSLISS